MQRRTGRHAAGEDEPAKRRQLGFEAIDEPLETLHVTFAERRLAHAFGDPVARIRQLRAEREQVLLDANERLAVMLEQLQRDLFALGAQLADPQHRIADRVTKASLTAEDVARLESWIDALETSLPALRHFILAGGAPAGAALHIARTVCRRAERRMVALASDPLLITYVNRLSDLLFVMARAANHDAGAPETEW